MQEENAPKIANIMCSFCWCGVIRLSKRPATTIYLETMPLTPCFQVQGSPAGAASTNLSCSARMCSNLLKMVSGDNVYLFIYLRRLVFAGVKESHLGDADGSEILCCKMKTEQTKEKHPLHAACVKETTTCPE